MLLSRLARSKLFDLKNEYDSVCTLLPTKVFSLLGSNKKIGGRPLAKVSTSSDAVGQCMSVCASHERCNALNFKKGHDEENCVLVQASRIVESEDSVGWLGYTTEPVCMPGCYRNAGRCLYQLPITAVHVRPGTKPIWLDQITNRNLAGKYYAHTRASKANHQLWFRLSFGRMIRVVRLLLYVRKNKNFVNEVFSVKVGMTEPADGNDSEDDVKKARYCANNVSEYPGETDDNGLTTRKDIYCYGPLEGRVVYLNKYTETKEGSDLLAFDQVIVFGEKM